MKKILLLILFIALSVYSLIYFYSEIDTHVATTGLYIVFNVPLVALQLLLSVYLFIHKTNKMVTNSIRNWYGYSRTNIDTTNYFIFNFLGINYLRDAVSNDIAGGGWLK
jgi:hypothetical protein